MAAVLVEEGLASRRRERPVGQVDPVVTVGDGGGEDGPDGPVVDDDGARVEGAVEQGQRIGFVEAVPERVGELADARQVDVVQRASLVRGPRSGTSRRPRKNSIQESVRGFDWE